MAADLNRLRILAAVSRSRLDGRRRLGTELQPVGGVAADSQAQNAYSAPHFYESKRGVRLTEAGQSAVRRIESIEAQLAASTVTSRSWKAGIKGRFDSACFRRSPHRCFQKW